MNYANIPKELRLLKQWGLFKLVWKEERNKYTKIPFSIDGTSGRSNDPNTWSTFEDALEAKDRLGLDGLAFYFANGYVGLDVDHVKDDIQRYLDGDITDNIVYDFISNTKSYTEISVSGEGIHIIVKGEIPGSKRRHNNVEMYESGRFFALTGNFFGNNKEVVKADLTHLYNTYVDNQKIVPLPVKENKSFGINDLSTQEIIREAISSKAGERFKKLLNGKWEGLYTSQSEADMAFANDLAFWTAKDFNKMDEIFRSSGLMRDKYDEKHGKVNYGVGLLNKAIAEVSETFVPKDDNDFQIYVEDNNSDDKQQKKFYSYDDTGNSERFMDSYGKLVKYDDKRKKFLYFDGHVWTYDGTMMVSKLVNRVVDNLKNEPVFVPEDGDDEEAKKARGKFIKRSRNHAGKDGMIKEIKPLISDDLTKYDTKTNVLNTPSGFVDLSTGELNETKPDCKFTRITNAEYSDTHDAPKWNEFLNQIFNGNQDLIRYIQKCVGYTLTGTTDEQCMFFLHGDKLKNGSNGKSVFVETLSQVLGTYSETISPDVLMVNKFSGSSNGPTPEIAKMKGARMIITSEPDEGTRLSEGIVKRLTGNEKITAREMYGESFTFMPTGVIWMSTNHKPIIRGTDDGIWRRLVFIPFLVQIPDSKKDLNLKDKLLREAPGILNWAVDGALMWQQEGLKNDIPEIVKSSNKSYRKEMDVIGNFLEDCCDLGDNQKDTFKNISTAFIAWEDIYGYNMSKRKLSRELSQRFNKRKSNGEAVYTGIALKDDKKPYEISVMGQ